MWQVHLVYAFTIHDSPWQNYDKICRVFWLNIAKFKINQCYRYCFKLFSNLRKEKELRQYHCRNSTKVGERKIKSRREKFFIFDNGIAAIHFAHSVARVGKKIGNCGNAIVENGRKKKQWLPKSHVRNFKKKVLHLQYFYNIFTTNHR